MLDTRKNLAGGGVVSDMIESKPGHVLVERRHRERAAAAVWPDRPGWDDDEGKRWLEEGIVSPYWAGDIGEQMYRVAHELARAEKSAAAPPNLDTGQAQRIAELEEQKDTLTREARARIDKLERTIAARGALDECVDSMRYKISALETELTATRDEMFRYWQILQNLGQHARGHKLPDVVDEVIKAIAEREALRTRVAELEAEVSADGIQKRLALDEELQQIDDVIRELGGDPERGVAEYLRAQAAQLAALLSASTQASRGEDMRVAQSQPLESEPTPLGLQGWISCADRMPERRPEPRELVLFVAGEDCVCAGYWVGEGAYAWVDLERDHKGNNFRHDAADVTYWMPMPEPPGDDGLEREVPPLVKYREEREGEQDAATGASLDQIRIDEAAASLLFALHIYPGHRLDSLGPLGCICGALAKLRPDVDAFLCENPGEFDAAYAKFVDEDGVPRPTSPVALNEAVAPSNPGLEAAIELAHKGRRGGLGEDEWVELICYLALQKRRAAPVVLPGLERALCLLNAAVFTVWPKIAHETRSQFNEARDILAAALGSASPRAAQIEPGVSKFDEDHDCPACGGKLDGETGDTFCVSCNDNGRGESYMLGCQAAEHESREDDARIEFLDEENIKLCKRVASLEAELAEKKAQLDAAAPMYCANCGPNVRIDEDGCCAGCGRDAFSVDDLPRLAAFHQEWASRDGNSPGYNLQKARTYGEQAYKYRKRLIEAGLATEADLEIANDHQGLLRERDTLRAQLTALEQRAAADRVELEAWRATAADGRALANAAAHLGPYCLEASERYLASLPQPTEAASQQASATGSAGTAEHPDAVMWFHASSNESEAWTGPFKTRNECIEQGKAEYDRDPFWIDQGLKTTAEMVAEGVDTDEVLERLEQYAADNNLAGEDGLELIYRDERAAALELEQWAARHIVLRSWWVMIGEAQQIHPEQAKPVEADAPKAEAPCERGQSGEQRRIEHRPPNVEKALTILRNIREAAELGNLKSVFEDAGDAIEALGGTR